MHRDENIGAGDNPVIIIGKFCDITIPCRPPVEQSTNVCLAAVKSVDPVLGSLRRDIDRTIGVIDDGLGIEEELGGVGKVRVLMSAVLARHCPATGETGSECPGNADGRRHRAFRAAATLEHEAPVPIGGRRETHLERAC
jgi:hypothetical protein